jgi:hypothetical protein
MAGPQGVQGAQGLPGVGGGGGGSQGSQGAQGSVGAQGAPGAQGSQGNAGSGSAGLDGAQGSQGASGPAGIQGAQGDVGSGSQGSQGAVGAQGAQGAQGSQGNIGAGTSGSQGSQGSIGSGAGKILQVVYAQSSTATTPSPLATYTSLTGISASITPANTSNTVLVTISIPYNTTRSAANTGLGIRIKRGSTVIWESTDDATGPIGVNITSGGGTTSQIAGLFSVTVQDSPATTSSTTYSVEGRVRSSANSGTVTFIPAGSTVTALGNILLREVGV